MKVYKISAVTLKIKNMRRSCNFYSRIPGFKLVYGGLCNDTFSTYEIGRYEFKMYLNLELITSGGNVHHQDKRAKQFGRIIFHTENVNKLYSYFRKNKSISNTISIENEPTDAPWGERYFHIREPDGYQLSFAKPKKNNKRRTWKCCCQHWIIFLGNLSTQCYRDCRLITRTQFRILTTQDGYTKHMYYEGGCCRIIWGIAAVMQRQVQK